jgi:biotin carboxyl carrier protein
MDVRLRTPAHGYQVRLAPEGPGFAATLDGTTHRVACAAAGPRAVVAGATVEELALDVDGRPCRVLVARRPDRVLVAFEGRVYSFETGEETRGGREGGAGSGAVTAPMPGKVIAVLVAAGDTVEAGQPVVVLEAMKMETTLSAEVAGRVAAVPAVPGTTVDAGALLVDITPADD